LEKKNKIQTNMGLYLRQTRVYCDSHKTEDYVSVCRNIRGLNEMLKRFERRWLL